MTGAGTSGQSPPGWVRASLVWAGSEPRGKRPSVGQMRAPGRELGGGGSPSTCAGRGLWDPKCVSEWCLPEANHCPKSGLPRPRVSGAAPADPSLSPLSSQMGTSPGLSLVSWSSRKFHWGAAEVPAPFCLPCRGCCPRGASHPTTVPSQTRCRAPRPLLVLLLHHRRWGLGRWPNAPRTPRQ